MKNWDWNVFTQEDSLSLILSPQQIFIKKKKKKRATRKRTPFCRDFDLVQFLCRNLFFRKPEVAVTCSWNAKFHKTQNHFRATSSSHVCRYLVVQMFAASYRFWQFSCSEGWVSLTEEVSALEEKNGNQFSHRKFLQRGSSSHRLLISVISAFEIEASASSESVHFFSFAWRRNGRRVERMGVSLGETDHWGSMWKRGVSVSVCRLPHFSHSEL